LDLGRQVLAKCFASGVTEYKEIAEELARHGVLEEEERPLLRALAGYRNRLVHFYHEVSPSELYGICAGETEDLLRIRDAFIKWIRANPEKIDDTL